MPICQNLPEIKIRKAKPKDFPRIRELHGLTFLEHQEREPDFEYEAVFVEQYLSRHFFKLRNFFGHWALRSDHIWVAEQHHEVVGYVIATRYRMLINGTASVICDISIDPMWRGKSVGRALLNTTTRKETRRGASVLHANIYPKNTASHALFKSFGFEPAPTELQKAMGPSVYYLNAVNLPRIAIALETARVWGVMLLPAIALQAILYFS